MEYPRIASLAPPVGPLTAVQYGAVIFAYVLDCGCTAGLSDAQLELADHVYPLLIGAPQITPMAVDRLSAIRHQILASLRVRRETEVPVQVPPSPVRVDAPDPGARVPVTTYPFKRPPSGQKVEINF